MTETYPFKAKECNCGQDLTAVTVPIAFFLGPVAPWGKCPGCDTPYPLDAPGVMEPEPEPEPEEKPAPRSRKKAEPEPEPEPEPEAEPESE